jgi:hypothetical protein
MHPNTYVMNYCCELLKFGHAYLMSVFFKIVLLGPPPLFFMLVQVKIRNLSCTIMHMHLSISYILCVCVCAF